MFKANYSNHKKPGDYHDKNYPSILLTVACLLMEDYITLNEDLSAIIWIPSVNNSSLCSLWLCGDYFCCKCLNSLLILSQTISG
jgi:hypothetical protein